MRVSIFLIGLLWCARLFSQGLEEDTPLGRLAVGVDRIEENQREKTTSADLRAGWVFVTESEEMIPTILELRPFFINRVEMQEEGQSNYQKGFGAGLRVALHESTDSRFTWYGEARVVSEEDSQSARRESGAEFELGLEIPLTDHASRQRTIRRLRALIPRDYLVLRVPSLREPRLSRELDHTGLLTMYWSWLLEAYQQQFSEKNYPYVETPEDRLRQRVRFVIELVKKREMTTRESDLLEGRGEIEDLRRLLDETIIEWLKENIYERHSLMIEGRWDSSSVGWTVINFRSLRPKEGEEKEFLNSWQMLEDFRENLLETLR